MIQIISQLNRYHRCFSNDLKINWESVRGWVQIYPHYWKEMQYESNQS